jgi:hypothetical protein
MAEYYPRVPAARLLGGAARAVRDERIPRAGLDGRLRFRIVARITGGGWRRVGLTGGRTRSPEQPLLRIAAFYLCRRSNFLRFTMRMLE